MISGSKGTGLDVKRVSWAPNATDLVGPLTAAGGQTADVIQTNTDPKGCVNLAKAHRASLKIDTPVVSEPLCLNPDVAKALGDIADVDLRHRLVARDGHDSDPAVAAVPEGRGRSTGAGRRRGDVWVPVVFGQTLTIAQWLNKIGADNDHRPDGSPSRPGRSRVPSHWGPPTIQCGKYPDRPAICSDQAKFYNYEGKGKFTPASGWLAPPE